MNIDLRFRRGSAPLALSVILFSGSIASAASVYDLTCVLNGLSGTTCTSGPSFGTVTLADGGVNQVTLSVNLLNPALKFRDLMLNFSGAGITGINSADGQASLSPDGFSLAPYSGTFDVGNTGSAQGWTGDSGYSTVLSGTGGTLSAAQFAFTDSLGNVFVALHIQSLACDGLNCQPGVQGLSSLKIGGLPNEGSVIPSEVPEPSTLVLLGIGLLIAGWVRFKQPTAVPVQCRSEDR